MDEKTYNLFDLKNYCALTSAKCAGLTEAASVCLEKTNHLPGVMLSVEGNFKGRFKLNWMPLEAAVFASWENIDEAVEKAAYALAILCVFELSPIIVVRQSMKGTGFDYWLGDKTSDNLKNEIASLEVSGILFGSKGRINQRVKEKIAQVKSGTNPNALTIVVVAEISRPLAKMIQRNCLAMSLELRAMSGLQENFTK